MTMQKRLLFQKETGKHYMQAFILINLLFFGLSEACTCGLATTQRVIRGQDVAAGSYPWIVSFATVQDGRVGGYCTGSLISPKYVLTVAHCVLVNAGDIYVAVDSWVGDLLNQEMYEKLYLVTSFKAFSNIPNVHNIKNFRNKDIAVMELERPVANVMPICLPTVGNDFANVQALLLGYGIRNQFQQYGKLQQGQMTVASADACNQSLAKKNWEMHSRELCAGDVNEEPAQCKGDSGGPLMYQDPKSGRWVVIGLVMGNFGCFDTMTYGIYTRVNSYLNFIDSNSNNTGCKQEVELSDEQCPCGKTPAGSSGTETYPWLASFVSLDSNEDILFACGATIIAPRYAISAASCVPRGVRFGRFVTLGSWGIDAFKNRQFKSLMKIEQIILYQNGAETRNQDIALLKLQAPVYVQPICLPAPESNFAGLTGVSIGLGKYKEGETPAEHFRKENVTIIDDSNCTQSLKAKNILVGDKEICGEKDSESQNCGRNPGDPLMYFDGKSGSWVLIGIVAQNTGCSSPGLFSKVTRYLNWIDNKIGMQTCKTSTGN